MRARKRRRCTLGAGEYEWSNEEKPSTKDAQDVFLDTVRCLVPDVLEALSKEVLDSYRKIPELCFQADEARIRRFERLNPCKRITSRYIWEHYERPWWGQIEDPPTSSGWDNEQVDEPRLAADQGFQRKPGTPLVAENEDVMSFRKNLLDWSIKHNLDEFWCRERAYDTLEFWCNQPELHARRSWAFRANYPQPFAAGFEPRFTFERKTQYPLCHTREGDFNLAIEEFKRQYCAFQDKLDASCEAEHTTAPARPAANHFEWLVRYHVLQCKYSDIATSYDLVDEPHLRHVVPELARLVDLRLTRRRGRPRKG